MSRTQNEHALMRRGALAAALPLALSSFFVCVAPRKRAAAGSVPVFEGTTAAGVSVLGETATELKAVRILINVPSGEAGRYHENSATITTAYTLYNPTKEEQTVSLAYPFELVRACQKTEDWNDPQNCTIVSGGEAVSAKIRYTYKKTGRYGGAEEAAQPFATQKELFPPTLSVIKYTYSVTLSQAYENYRAVNLVLNGDARTGVVREYAGVDVKNGYRLLCYATNEKQFTVSYYALGGECEVSGASCDIEEETPVVTLVSKETTAFSEYCKQFRPAWIDADDWYLACVDYFEDTQQCGTYPALQICAEQAFVRWYCYGVTIPAGQTSEHSITAPFYPATSRKGERYCIKLSSFANFSGLGDFSVEVKTPLMMDYSNMEFTRTGETYTLQRSGCPYGNLDFFLVKEKESVPFEPSNEHDPLVTALIILAVVAAGAAAVTIVLAVKSRRAHRRSELLRKQADRCRPAEGKIEPDDNENK